MRERNVSESFSACGLGVFVFFIQILQFTSGMLLLLFLLLPTVLANSGLFPATVPLRLDPTREASLKP